MYIETLSTIEQTLANLVRQLTNDNRLDEASEVLDVEVLVHRLMKKVWR